MSPAARAVVAIACAALLASGRGAAAAAPAGEGTPAAAADVDAAAAAPPPLAPRRTTPYDLDVAPHLALTAGMFAVVGLAQAAVNPVLPGGHPCPVGAGGDACDPARLGAWDRWSVGAHSLAWRRISDVGSVAAIGLPLLLAAGDGIAAGSDAPLADAATDGLVVLQGVAAATFVNHLWKYAVRRPRPGLYRPGAQSVEGQLSYPSGHTSATAAGAAAYAVGFALRHPRGPWRHVVAGGAAAVVLLTGYGRIAGGMHFTSDVVAGAALGAALGTAIPLLHRRRLQPRLLTLPRGGLALALRGALR